MRLTKAYLRHQYYLNLFCNCLEVSEQMKKFEVLSLVKKKISFYVKLINFNNKQILFLFCFQKSFIKVGSCYTPELHY